MESAAVASAEPVVVVENARFGERFVFTGSTPEVCAFDFYVAPRRGMPMLHKHGRQSEVFRCRRGELTVLLKGETRVVRAGEEFTIPAGTLHAFENRGDVEVYCEVEYRPAGRNMEWLMVLNACERATGREPGLLDLAPFINDVDIYVDGPPVWVQRALFGWVLRPIALLTGRKRRLLERAREAYGRPIDW